MISDTAVYIILGGLIFVFGLFLRERAANHFGLWHNMFQIVPRSFDPSPSGAERVRQGVGGCLFGMPEWFFGWLFIICGPLLALLQANFVNWLTGFVNWLAGVISQIFGMLGI